MRMNKTNNQHGFTLMEIIVVIVVLGIVSAVAMRSMDAPIKTARFEQTKEELAHLAWAIAGNPNLYNSGSRTDFGYVGDVGALPAGLDSLVNNPGYSTWNGPYMNAGFGSTDIKLDAWGRAYLYSGGITLKSAGSGTDTIVRTIASSTADLIANTVSGTITDAAGNPPGDSASSVSVTLSYPDGTGGTSDSVLTVSSGGQFSFVSMVPVGNHEIRAIYAATDDTTSGWISVMPGGTSISSLRFPGALWAASGGGGGGGSSGDLVYVPGSAQCTGGSNEDMQFNIYNDGSAGITVTWMVVTYSHSPTSYFEIVKWDGSTKFDSSSPRAASGDTISFSSSGTIAVSDSKTIVIENYRDAQSGGGSDVDMSGTDMTVTFSDGSTINFNSGY